MLCKVGELTQDEDRKCVDNLTIDDNSEEC